MPNNVGGIFLSRLKLEIKKICVMQDHANMESLLSVTLEVEWMLVELGEAPFEMLKEK